MRGNQGTQTDFVWKNLKLFHSTVPLRGEAFQRRHADSVLLAHRAFRTVLKTKRLVCSTRLRHQLDHRKYHDPHGVDEMPEPGNEHHTSVVLQRRSMCLCAAIIVIVDSTRISCETVHTTFRARNTACAGKRPRSSLPYLVRRLQESWANSSKSFSVESLEKRTISSSTNRRSTRAVRVGDVPTESNCELALR